MLLPCLELQSSPAHRYSLIILHGLGADGDDFVPDDADLTRLKKT